MTLRFEPLVVVESEPNKKPCRHQMVPTGFCSGAGKSARGTHSPTLQHYMALHSQSLKSFEGRRTGRPLDDGSRPCNKTKARQMPEGINLALLREVDEYRTFMVSPEVETIIKLAGELAA